MNKKNQSLIIAIVIAMAVIGVLLILLVGIQSKVETVKEQEPTTEKEEVVLETTEEEKSSQEKESVSDTNFDYDADIQDKVANIEKVVTIDGESFGIPCKFGEIKDKFDYLEEVPETLPGGGYAELHALAGDVDTGVTLMLVNTSEANISTNDMYVGTIIIEEKVSSKEIAVGNIKIGSQLEDIENFIQSGNYHYEVSETEYEKVFYIDVEGESVSLTVVYDAERAYVYRMILEYVVS